MIQGMWRVHDLNNFRKSPLQIYCQVILESICVCKNVHILLYDTITLVIFSLVSSVFVYMVACLVRMTRILLVALLRLADS